jgi:hypothetical protein
MAKDDTAVAIITSTTAVIIDTEESLQADAGVF